MKALIIAAGEGSRLGALTEATPKPLIRLLGLSLIERTILTAKQAGIFEFVVVVGYLGEKIRAKLGDGSKYGVEISYVENKDWQQGNGGSVLAARKFFDDRFILLMADHVFDPRILRALVDCDGENSVVLAVDRRETMESDTKVLEESGRIVDIGKSIGSSNCIDTGIFRCSPRIFSYLEETTTEGQMELADGIAKAAANHDAEVFNIAQVDGYDPKMRKAIRPWCVDVDTEEDLRRAKETIIENASKNPSDALAFYVHKPIENRLVAFISKFNITPNQLTLVVNLLAYTVAALFLSGGLLVASLLSFVVGILDGLDGKLARVTLRTSRLGSLEHSFDLLFEFTWIIALSVFLFKSTGSATPLIVCALIILFVAFYRNVYDRFRRASGRSLDDYGDFERIFRRVAGRRNLFNVLILIGVLLNVPLLSLLFVAFHAGITAIVYASRAMKHLSVLDQQGA